jgi:hypothetical protein
VLGPVIMVLTLVFILPATFMVLGAIVAAVLGQSLWRDGEERDERSQGSVAVTNEQPQS